MSCKSLRLRAVFAVVFFLALSLLVVPYSRGQSVKKIHQQAEKFYKAKKYEKAAPLYIKAAKQGHAHSQSRLGWLYEEGNGVKQDNRQAAEWYRRAAEQGYAWGQHSLGELYEKGKGVEKNIPLAYALYLLAVEAREGNIGAQNACQRHQENNDERTDQGRRKNRQRVAATYRGEQEKIVF